MTDQGTQTQHRTDTIYADDPDGKKYYEMRDHDAMLLTLGDVLARRGRLQTVKDVRKKTVRGGVDWTITLDDGFTFDPRDDFVSGFGETSMRGITFWRPRKGF